MRYRFWFSVRRVGAIGISYPLIHDQESDDPKKALDQAWETVSKDYEIFTVFRTEVIEEKPNE